MDLISLKKDGLVGLVTLERADAANALSKALAAELAQTIESAGKDSALRALVITGAGNRVFSAGADLKERQGMDEPAWRDQHHALEHAVRAILACEKPIIAAVNGAAYGGGFELALACDFIYAGTHAKFAFTEATLGIMPGMGGTQTLARAVGERRAREILFSGKVITAEEGLAYGFVNRVCESAVKDAMAAAQDIAANAPLAVTAIKRSIKEGITLPLDKALLFELEHYNALLATSDRKEGIAAWNEKRKPTFNGN
jgi:enoyl-CoA hydratase